MRFLHCSDFHLDSRMETNLTPAQARERSRELCQTFARMVDYAISRQVTAVLIAGDLFDTGRATARTVDFVMAQIRRAAGIDFLYLRGNHDELTGVGETPENLKTFCDVWQYYRYGSVVVAGIELTRDNCTGLYAQLELAPEDTNIVMLHGMASSRAGQEQIALPKLRGRHIAYLALGHIHSYEAAPLDGDSVYCYCGCPEGRGFDECGEKGIVELEIEDGAVRRRFVPMARRQLHEIPVDISGLYTVPELQTAMERAAEAVDSDHLVKFTLTGSYTLETQKDLPFLQKLLESRFYAVKIKDETRLQLEPESYEHDISLKGEFIRMVMASDKTETQKEQIILCGMQALFGEEVGF